MGVSKPYALDAIDAAAKALVDHRGHYANAKHPDGLKGSAFLWAVADEIGTDQRYIDEREDMREEVVIVALAIAAAMAKKSVKGTGQSLRSAATGRFAVSASKTAKGNGVLTIERNGVPKNMKARFYSPNLAYHHDQRKK